MCAARSQLPVAESRSSERSEGTTANVASISRHRRIHKEVGAVTGISFLNAPEASGGGVLVCELKPDGACAKAGVRIGDHITKINGQKPTDRAHAVKLCDAAWKAEADGVDKNKDRCVPCSPAPCALLLCVTWSWEEDERTTHATHMCTTEDSRPQRRSPVTGWAMAWIWQAQVLAAPADSGLLDWSGG